MSELSVYDKVTRLVEFATGEPYGDGMLVTNVISGYAEPGYGNGSDVVVLGDWNPKRFRGGNEPELTTVESLSVRLAEALERVGACIEWLDEWTECQGCYRAVRTSADSYSWKPSFAIVDGCELLCAECLHDMGEDALEDYVNDSDQCVTWCEPSHVESLGYVQWKPGDEQTYESGWHPGQTDNPADILAEIHAAHPDASVVFFLAESSQFYVRFNAYVKFPTED